jgi:hypothetical protein
LGPQDSQIHARNYGEDLVDPVQQADTPTWQAFQPKPPRRFVEPLKAHLGRQDFLDRLCRDSRLVPVIDLLADADRRTAQPRRPRVPFCGSSSPWPEYSEITIFWLSSRQAWVHVCGGMNRRFDYAEKNVCG